MTALAGVWRFDGRLNLSDFCSRMLAAQKIYGPHGCAYLEDGPVALGRRLMRTLPEDIYDRQPLITAGRYMLVADIRLDNRDELCEQLNISAGKAPELSDADILLCAIEKWSDACTDRLVGDYAFALWDKVHRRLILARDPLGQRPLYYHRQDRFFAFASMPKGLYGHPDIPYEADEERIAESLLLPWELSNRSFFKGIERVKSGHIIEVSEGGAVSTRRHWSPPRAKTAIKNPEELSEALREHLDRAVMCRLRGANNVGAHLSSGFDSSAVAATAARLLAPSGRKVIAFTAVPMTGFERVPPRGQIFDESVHAAEVAALYPNIDHLLIRAEGRSLFEGLERYHFLFDEPTLSISNSNWWYAICDATREKGLKVLLTGQDGNMGLSYNGQELFPELFRSGRWFYLYKEMRYLVAQRKSSWRGAIAMAVGPWIPATLWDGLNRLRGRTASNALSHTAINRKRYEDLDLASRAKRAGVDLSFRPWKNGFEMRLWNLFNSDPGNSNKGVLGGWQIDQRDPTADIRLIEFCLSVPTSQFFRHGISKVLARRALSDRLPGKILNETRRGVQAADWFERLIIEKQRVASELTRLDACPEVVNMLDLPRLHRLIDEWPTENLDSDEVYADYRATLLRSMSAGLFLRHTLGTNT